MIEGPILFYAAISVVIAFALGFGGGIAAVLIVWSVRGSIAAKIPAVRNLVSTAWAYDQVAQRIRRGATLDQLQDFLDDEDERISEALLDAGEEAADLKAEYDSKVAQLARKLETAQREADTYKRAHDELHIETCRMRALLAKAEEGGA